MRATERTNQAEESKAEKDLKTVGCPGLSPAIQWRGTERKRSKQRAVGNRERLRSGVKWNAIETPESGELRGGSLRCFSSHESFRGRPAGAENRSLPTVWQCLVMSPESPIALCRTGWFETIAWRHSWRGRIPLTESEMYGESEEFQSHAG